MKKIFPLALAAALAASCNYVADMNKDVTDSTAMSADSLMLYYDESITEVNAYSDLFLDSATLENYIRKEGLADSSAQELRRFYRVRNYQYAWMASDGLTEHGRGFWNLYGETKDSSNTAAGDFDRAAKARMDSLMEKDSMTITRGDSSYALAEMELTKEFVNYARAHLPLSSSQALYFMVPAKKIDAMNLADSLLNRHADSAFYAGNTAYNALKHQLALYYKAAQQGGWQPLAAGRLRKGQSSPAVAALKKRLVMTGDYSTGDTTAMYSDSLAAAVSALQERYGLRPTGEANDSLVKALNVPVEKRIEQILINLNRVAWMPAQQDSVSIRVNIPDYMLYVNGDSAAWKMPVIVGKEGTGTAMFTGAISQVVFSPYWNIPESIVREEILPKMRKDPNYLSKNKMEKVGGTDSLPQLRQLPGGDNPLGRVKFLFPNSYEIYLHDTPQKELFAKKDRALSHGCIRVQDAKKLAVFLLKDQPEWTPAKIEQAMNGNKEQTIQVKRPVPVQITYYTVWADAAGKVHFRDDLYGRDGKTAAKMFTGS